MQAEELEALFYACDLNLSGFIEKHELEVLCEDLKLTATEFEEIFRSLDGDHDGKISKKDFLEGFNRISDLIMRKKKGNSPSGSPLLQARTFSFEKTEGVTDDDDGGTSITSSVSTASARSSQSSKRKGSTKSCASTTISTRGSLSRIPGSVSKSGSGRSTPRKRTAQSAVSSLDNNRDEFERLLGNLDPGYHQLNKNR